MTSILDAIFYIILVVFLLYSLLAIYALLKEGRSKSLSIIVTLVYLAMATAIYFTAVIHLNNIKG